MKRIQINEKNVSLPQTKKANLSKLSDVLDNDIVKKNVNDRFITKVNATDTKVPSTSGLDPKIQ